MKPTYVVRVWQDDEWWLARVIEASADADEAPLNAVTQARTLTRIDGMIADLIATILDADDDSFGLQIEYDLPQQIHELLEEAEESRALLDAAQTMWQQSATQAARALTTGGFSLREAAKLLGLSFQRVDQLLRGEDDPAWGRWALVRAESLAAREAAVLAQSPRLDVAFVLDAGPGETVPPLGEVRLQSLLLDAQQQIRGAVTGSEPQPVEVHSV
jgi:hypothetical protein